MVDNKAVEAIAGTKVHLPPLSPSSAVVAPLVIGGASPHVVDHLGRTLVSVAIGWSTFGGDRLAQGQVWSAIDIGWAAAAGCHGGDLLVVGAAAALAAIDDA